MSLRERLDLFYETFDFESHMRNDPIEFPHRYHTKRDREVVALISALFAYGRVQVFKAFLEAMFGVMGSSPYAFIMEFRKNTDAKRFKKLRYRFHTEQDIVGLLQTIKSVLSVHGSLKRVFLRHYERDDKNIRNSLSGFINFLKKEAGTAGKDRQGFHHFFPSLQKGSSCKRLNLFLRWMVRDRDIDLGLWKELPKNRLIIPLDTHVARIAQCLNLTRRKSVDWKTAEEVTDSLRKLDPEDPLKYDFALCHQGISGLCKADMSLCNRCGIMGMRVDESFADFSRIGRAKNSRNLVQG